MKKIFTIRRIILLMSLILIYSCAFLFVKIYAERSILSSSEPSGTSLNVQNDTEENIVPAETADSEPIEYIVNKMNADGYPMLMVAATHVPDTIDIAPASETPVVTTPPAVSESPATTTTPAPTETKATSTEPPETASTEQSAENIDGEREIEDMDDENSEKIDEPEIEEPDDNTFGDLSSLTPEELQDLLDRLGLSGLNQDNSNSYFPDDVLYSGNSYKNQTITFYDTTQKRLRTDNAFDIVCEITNYEISSRYNPEAIKAQAIAIYSYLKYYEQKGEYAEIGSKSNVPSEIVQCVEAIDGLAMYYDGKYVMAAFSASTGGYSAASKNVWGSDQPYLQSVKNDFDYLDERYYGLVTTYTVDEIREKIESKTDIKLSNNYSEWVRVLNYNDNIYAGQLSIDGHTSAYINGRERTITGHIFRTYVLNIRSTAFTVSYANGVFSFTTYGYGHGVGMSQVGADLYATYGGYTFDQILHHYYTGVTIR